jgi:hypothetical protein
MIVQVGRRVVGKGVTDPVLTSVTTPEGPIDQPPSLLDE